MNQNKKDPDNYILGYPKTGNTWFQVMLLHIFSQGFKIDFEKIPWSPRVYFFAPNPSEKKIIIDFHFTHYMPNFNIEPYSSMKLDLKKLKDKKVILLIRNPKDTLVSLYMHNVFRSGVYPPGHSLDEMVHDEIYGIRKYIEYYRQLYHRIFSWDSHCLIKYEDLHSPNKCFRIIKEVMQYLEVINVPDDYIRNSITYAAFENMQKLEKNQTLKLKSLGPPETGSQIQNAMKVRKGKVGDYKNNMHPNTIAYINSEVDIALPKLYGYRT
jgi:hypothetical protein